MPEGGGGKWVSRFLYGTCQEEKENRGERRDLFDLLAASVSKAEEQVGALRLPQQVTLMNIIDGDG